MAQDKDQRAIVPRGALIQQRVLDAAERLLRLGKADFSMRDLASEAGVSFATPFNRFGSKHGIMQALSDRRIDIMEARYIETKPKGDIVDRVLAAVEIAVAVMLEEPGVNRAVMGWLGAPDAARGNVLARSAALWSLALRAEDGTAPDQPAPDHLSEQLAFGFRGVLSFWTAGELADGALSESAKNLATALLRGVAERESPALSSTAHAEDQG